MLNRDDSTRSVMTLSSLKDPKEIKTAKDDSALFRVNFLKNLLKDKDLDPIMDLDDTTTESFIGRSIDNKIGKDDDSGESYDTRVVLKKRIHDFANIITQIGGRLQYIKSGTTGHTFKGIASGERGNFEYAVKVVAYPKKERYGNINDVRRPENAEIRMIKLLSMFVLRNQTPHIVLPFGTFDTSIKMFTTLIEDDMINKNNEKYKEFVERYKKGDYHDNVSILISEWANRGDLMDFIRNNYKDFTPIHWKVIFFQLLSTLAVIQSRFPSFRHNDLKANNVLVHKINMDKDKIRYKIVKTIYRVPNIGYHIKLWDFDFACIPGIVDNVKVASEWTKAINVTPEQNRYYDTHYFFNTLTKKGFFPQFLTEDCIPKDAKDFVMSIVPEKYASGSFVHKRGRMLINDEYLTPDEILKTNPYFEEFRLNTSNIIKKRSLTKEKLSTNIHIATSNMVSGDNLKKVPDIGKILDGDNNGIDIIKLLMEGGKKAREGSLKRNKKERKGNKKEESLKKTNNSKRTKK